MYTEDNNKLEDLIHQMDLSKMENGYVDLVSICKEFDIHEYLLQHEDNVKLTYCYYHKWTCTDTEVGIKVWFMEENSTLIPVCVSIRPYRKTGDRFFWLSMEAYHKVFDYLNTLKFKSLGVPALLSNYTLTKSLELFDQIEHKQFETKNVK